jgi:hypothetical protein
MFGSKNSESWTSFYNRNSDLKRNKKRNNAGGDCSRGNPKVQSKRSIWTAVVHVLAWDCIRPSDYDSDDDCEWAEETAPSFNTYSWNYQTDEEGRRIQLMT